MKEDSIDRPAALLDALPVAGQKLGRYLVLERIGEGGMGVVLAAYDPYLDRKIALKVIRSEHRYREGLHQRLQREAQVMAKLAHPNVVPVYDVGIGGDDVFLAMEWVSGGTLTAWCSAAKRTPAAIVAMFIAAGRGLAAAHECGIVHCDFKADNILVGADERPRVTDFGIARRAAIPPSEIAGVVGQAGFADARSIGADGEFLGTPAYMAPEQLRGEAADARSDVYSFSVALFEALTGKHPFRAATLAEFFAALERGVSVQALGKIPRRLRRPLEHGLAAQPEARAQTMNELLHELDRAIRPPRWAWPVAGAVVLAAVGATLARAHRERPPVCTGGDDRASAVWSVARKGAAKRAFLATGAPYAERVWDAVDRDLDQRTHAWAAMYTEACTATRVRGTQSEALLDRRGVCLDDDLRAVDAQADVFSRADAVVVEHAERALEKLPPLSRCADGRALLRDTEPLPSGVPKDKIDDAARRLAAAQAEAAAGHVRQSLATLPALVGEIRALGYQTIEARALTELAGEEDRVSDHAASLGHAHDAAVLAARWDEASTLEHAWLEAAGALVSLGRTDDALLWLRYEDAELDRAPDAVLRAAASVLRLEALAKEGHKVPLADIEAARTAIEASGGPPLDVARHLGNLAIVAGRSGHPDVGQDITRRTHAIFLEAYGPDHPDTQADAQNLAAAAILLEHFDEAFAIASDLYASRSRTLAPDDPDMAYTTLALAEAEDGRKHSDQALLWARRAEAIVRKSLPDDLFTLFEAKSDEGRALFELGRLAEARDELEAAEALGAKVAFEPLDLADNRFFLAQTLRSLGDAAGARAQARKAIDALSKAAEGDDNAEHYAKERDRMRDWLGESR